MERPQTPSHRKALPPSVKHACKRWRRRLDQIYRVDPVEAPGESNFFPALLLRHQKPCQPVHNGRRREAEQPVCGESGCVACAALAHAWQSRAGRHRTGTSTMLVERSTRLSSAAARSMAAITVPARGTVECVEYKNICLNGGSSSASRERLSSLERFLVRQSVFVY